MPVFLRRLHRHLHTSLAGEHWPGRLVVLLAVAYVGWCHATDADRHQWFGGVNLFIHECGHFVLVWAWEWLHVAGGSLVQCLVPLLFLLDFARRGDHFAAGIMGIWLATNLFGVAMYVDDARALDIPLFVPFQGIEEEDKSGHDWHYLLERLGWLQHDHQLAAWVAGLGWVLLVGASLWCLYVLLLMALPPPAAESPQADD